MDASQRRMLQETRQAGLFGIGISDIINVGKGVVDVFKGGSRRPTSRPGQSLVPIPSLPQGRGPCPAGAFRVGDNCVDPRRALPGGKPMISPAAADQFGAAVVGAFGIPALEPQVIPTTRMRCPKGTVLGEDDLCYNKGSIPVKYRKWRPGPKPVVSRADQKAIQRADRARKRLVSLTKKAGAHASLTKPRTRK